jgi:hypothetical protein
VIIVQAAAAAVSAAALFELGAAASRGWGTWRQLERARAEQPAAAAQPARQAEPGSVPDQ